VVVTVVIDQQAAPGVGPPPLILIERKDPLTLLTSENVIEAPTEVVWQVLVDFDSYSRPEPGRDRSKRRSVRRSGN